MKAVSIVGALMCATLVGGAARGDASPTTTGVDKTACMSAVSRGQRLRDAHELVEAREEFRVCARPECPAVVKADCAAWLGEIDRTLPTVVLAARDGAGKDVIDATVTLDGRPLVRALDGAAVAVDPGMHAFQFQRRDGSRATQQVMVREGEKAQHVSVVLSATGGPETAPATETGSAAATSESPPGRTARLLGIALGAAGVLGMGVGLGIAVDAKAKDNQAANEPGIPRQTDSGSAVNEANVATVVIGVGAALAGVGLVLWLTAPKATADPAAESSRNLRNLGVGIDGRQVILRGTF